MEELIKFSYENANNIEIEVYGNFALAKIEDHEQKSNRTHTLYRWKGKYGLPPVKFDNLNDNWEEILYHINLAKDRMETFYNFNEAFNPLVLGSMLSFVSTNNRLELDVIIGIDTIEEEKCQVIYNNKVLEEVCGKEQRQYLKNPILSFYARFFHMYLSDAKARFFGVLLSNQHRAFLFEKSYKQPVVVGPYTYKGGILSMGKE